MSRQNNIALHTQDLAKQVLLEKQKLTNGLQQANNLQDVLDLIGESGLKSYQLPLATQNEFGIVRAATQDETNTGADPNLFVQPLTLKNIVTKPEATETVKGIARFSTDSDGLNESDRRSIINPAVLHNTLTNRRATESKVGTVILSSKAQAESGTDNQSVMTPIRVKQAILKFTPKVEFATASETISGYTRLATRTQVAAGTLNVGYAVQPKSFIETRASTTQVGTTKIATTDEVRQGQSNDTVVSPYGLKTLLAQDTQFGLVKVSPNLNQNDSRTALSVNANVVPTSRRINNKNLQADVTLTAKDIGTYTATEIDARIGGLDQVPVGQIQAFAGAAVPQGWFLCHGQQLNKRVYPELFKIIGYTYGGSGDSFNLPDLRGEFLRGFDQGKGIDPGRTLGSKQKPTLNCSNAADYTGAAHGLAIGPNLQGEGRWEWERPGERCRYNIYHCRNHPPRWIGPENVSGKMSAWDATRLLGGDYVQDPEVQGVWHTWAQSIGNGNTVGTIPNNRQIGSGHLIYGTRPRNVAVNYIIKATSGGSNTLKATGNTYIVNNNWTPGNIPVDLIQTQENKQIITADYFYSRQGMYIAGDLDVNDVFIRQDKNKKHNIQNFQNALEKVSKLNGAIYQVNDGYGFRDSAGLIAQDVQNVEPILVKTDPNNDMLRLNYNGVIGLLVEAIKELKSEVDELKKKS